MTSPPLARLTLDGRRLYCHPVTGEMVPSVTTVIDVAVAKPALVDWAGKMAALHAVSNWEELGGLPVMRRVEQIRWAHRRAADEAADIGDAVHETIEAWSKGEKAVTTKRTDSYLNQFIAFMMDRRPRFIENEVTVWSRTHGYAGTADWIAEIGGHVYLGDNKTGKRVYPEVGMQLSALASADFIIRQDGTEEPMPQVDFLAALHVRPRSWKLVPVNHRDDNFGAFLAAKHIYDWTQSTAPVVLGRAA